MRRLGAVIWCAAMASTLSILAALGPIGCQAPPRSTRVTINDIQDMTAAVAQSLLQSDALAQRGPDSDKWVVSMEKVTNLSSEVMSQSEQWAIMARVRGAVPIVDLAESKNLYFVLPPQRVAAMRDNENLPELETYGSRREVTHILTATFRSVTRATADERSDLYYLEFEIIDLSTNVPVWNDKFEFKRVAKGEIRD